MKSSIFFVIILAFFLSACQSGSPTTISNENSSPTATNIPQPIVTPTTTITPVPTIVPTATSSPQELQESAGTLCEKAFSASVEPTKFEVPYIGMIKTELNDNPAWAVSNSIPHLFALSKDSVKTIICVLESRREAGIYTDGSTAFQIIQKVRIVSWPDGKVLESNVFEGGPPPKTKVGFGSGYGSYPTGVSSWLLDQLNEANRSDFLFLPEEESGSSIAISPDGKLVALAVLDSSDDSKESSKIMLLDSQNLQTVSTWNTDSGKINDLTFSSDGRIIASVGSDSNIVFWDTQTGTKLGMTTLPSAAYVIKYSPDGILLAALTTSELYLVDSSSMEIKISRPTSGKTLSFSPDGKIIYTDEGSIDAITGNFIHQFYDYTQLIPTLSPDGGVSYDMPDFISNFTLSPDGTYGISYSFATSQNVDDTQLTYTLSVLDAQTAKRLSEIEFSAISFNILGFSPDGKQMALNIGPEIWLLDTFTWQTGQILTGHTGVILDSSFSPDGQKFISLSTDRTVRIWSIEN